MALHNYIYSKHKDTDFAVSKIARDHDPRPISIHPLELEHVNVNVNDHEEQEHEKINSVVNNSKEIKESSSGIDQLNVLNNSYIKYNHDEYEDATSDSDCCDTESSDSSVGLNIEKHSSNYENESSINGDKSDNEDNSVGNISSNLDKLNCNNKVRWVIKEGKLRKLKSRFDNNKKDKKRRRTKKNEKHVINLDGDMNNSTENDTCSPASIDNVNIIGKRIENSNRSSSGGSVEIET